MIAALLDRLGDRINPITVKEARQAVGSRLVAGALLLFLTVQLVALTLMVTTRDTLAGNPDELNLRAGRDVFLVVQGILLSTCMLLVPALTAGRLANERSETNVDLLFISALSPRAVVAGKLAAATALILLMFSACAPFMAFAYLLRGLDVPTIGVVLAIDFVAVIAGTMFALLIASFPVNRGFRALLGIGGFIALIYAFAGAMAATSAILQFGAGIDLESWEFWAAFAGLAALILGVTGLMFVWSVALLTPPTANRALIPRSYTLLFWLATAAGCGVWSYVIDRYEPIIAWGLAGVTLAVLQLIIAISERDTLGPRVRRRIPRSLLLRAPAFLVYSGAAGGLLFAVGLGVLSIVGLWAWPQLNPTLGGSSNTWESLRMAGLFFGYAYCYALTAVVLRRLLSASIGFRSEQTWIIALLLFAFGCVVPFMAEAMFVSRPYQGLYRDEMLLLYLPNPFVSIDRAVRSASEPHFDIIVTVLILWGTIATLFLARWMLGQVRGFRPLERVVTEPTA